MAETTVKIGGDSQEAVRELRQVGRAAADVGVSLKSMAGQAALTGLAVVGMDNAVAAIQKTIEFASQSMAKYIERNQRGADAAARASQAFDNLQASIGSIVLGGGNAELLFSNLTQALNETAKIIDENSDAWQAFSRDALALFVDGIGVSIEAIAAARIVFVELRAAVEASVEGLILLDSTIRTVVTGGLTEIYRQVNDLEGPLDRFLRRSGEITGQLDISRGSAEAFAEQIGGMSQSFAMAAARIREGQVATDAQIMSLDELIERYAVLDSLFNPDGQSDTGGGGGGGGGPSDEERKAEARAAREIANFQRKNSAIAAQQAAHAAEMIRIADEAAQRAEAKAEESRRMIEEKRLLHEQRLTEIMQQEADRRNRLSEIEFEQQAALLAKRQEMAQQAAGSIGGLINELAAGQRKALNVIKEFVGQELIAKGQSFLLEAAAMAFIPGKQPLAAGLIAASVAMIAAGAKLSKSGGGARSTSAASAGTAPLPQAAQATDQRSVTTQVNFGVVGDPRAAAQMVADMNRRAIREGYTAGAA